MTFRSQACYFNQTSGNNRMDDLSTFSKRACGGNGILSAITEYHLAFLYEVPSNTVSIVSPTSQEAGTLLEAALHAPLVSLPLRREILLTKSLKLQLTAV